MIYFMPPEIWKYSPLLRSYTFFDRREQFVKTESVFGVWALIGVEAGAFDYEVGGERGHAMPGDLILGAPQQSIWRSATAKPISYHVLQWLFEDDDGWQPGKWPVQDATRLFANYAQMRAVHGKTDEFSRWRLQNLLADVLMLAWETRHAPPKVNDPTMRHAAQLLAERVGEVFSMSDVSSTVGLRPVQFTRRFRKAHGTTPIEYLTRLRLENARRLLIETDATLDEIAESCGWSSGYYLSEVFKRAHSMAPGQFRRLHRV